MSTTKLLLVITPFLTISTLNAQLSTDTSVKVLPHWKKDERHSVTVRSTTDKYINGKSDKIISTFNASFSIIEKDTSGYTIEWTYKNATLAPNRAMYDDKIFARLVNEKMLVKITPTGRVKELINNEEIKLAVDRAITQLLSALPVDTTEFLEYKAARQLVSTPKGVEIFMLKHFKFYNLSFGFIYKTSFVQTNIIKFPNPLGGQPIEGLEKVKLTNLDNRNNTCTIETEKSGDGNVLKNDIITFLKNNYKSAEKEVDRVLQNVDLQLSETTTQQLDFSRGLMIKGRLTRIVNLGIQKRLAMLDIETVD